MIYDTFPFFNELELLEVRLHELNPVVDQFVLAESTRTHSNKPKPLHFQENRSHFKQFLSKITHVIVDNMPDTSDTWALEGFQRTAVARGLTGCRPSDIVLNSDIDEIPRASAILELQNRMHFSTTAMAVLGHGLLRHPLVVRLARNLFKKNHPYVRVLEQRQFYFHLNSESMSIPAWPGTRAVFYRDFTSAYDLRRWDGRRVHKAGWHFSYMGGAERVREKIQAYAHQEYNKPDYTDPQQIQSALREGKWLLDGEHQLRQVVVDESYPDFITRNKEKFADWMRPITQQSVTSKDSQ